MKNSYEADHGAGLFSPLTKFISLKWIWVISAISSFSFFAVILFVFRVLQPDLDEHILISEGMWKNGKIPAHPLFYLLIQVFSLFTNNITLEIFAAFIIFSFAQTFKIVAGSVLAETITKKKLSVISFVGVFISSWIITPGVFENHFIINQMVPNFFHNGTLLLSIPFSIWMLRNIYLLVEEDDFSVIRQIIYSGLLAGLSKPSFLFCIIPVFPCYVLMRKGISRQLLSALQISLLFTFLIIGQSLYLRINPPNYISSFKIQFLPFFQYGTVFQHFKTLFYSLLIPAILYFSAKHETKTSFIGFLAGCHLFGLGIAFCLVDSINGIKFNNMTWQTSVTLLLLLISLSGIFFQSDKIRLSRKSLVLVFLLLNLGYFGWYSFHVILYRSFFV